MLAMIERCREKRIPGAETGKDPELGPFQLCKGHTEGGRAPKAMGRGQDCSLVRNP